MAIVLQVCSVRLGVVTGKDLAQAGRDYYPTWTALVQLDRYAEIAITACDLAEVLGSAVAIHLLFPQIPLSGPSSSPRDVLLLLSLQSFGMRIIEAFILVLVLTIGACYFIEIFVLPQTQPQFREMGHALLTPGFRQKGMIYVAIGIIGADGDAAQSVPPFRPRADARRFSRMKPSIKRAIQLNTIDSVVALSIAFLVNASILVLAAITFFGKDSVTLASGQVIHFGQDWIQEAYHTLAPLLGTTAASILFAIALLASGQSSTVTGTLAGQVVMEGFMHWRVRPWVRRMVTRAARDRPSRAGHRHQGQSKCERFAHPQPGDPRHPASRWP